MNTKDFLVDKRDENYNRLYSSSGYFESFNHPKLKSDIIIPHTIIFEGGSPTLWLFNSSKEKSPVILRKNSERLSLYEVGKFFAHQIGFKNLEDFRIDTLQALKEYLQKNYRRDVQPVVFVKYNDDKTDQITVRGLLKILLEAPTRIQFLQKNVDNHSKAQEVYYIEYRHDENTLPVGWKYYKKAYKMKKEIMDMDLSYDQNYDEEDYQENPIYYNKKVDSQIFKFFDNQLNVQFSNIVTKYVEFVQKAFKIKIRKFVGKFILSSKRELVFIGGFQMLVDIPNNAPYDRESLLAQFKEQTYFKDFQLFIKDSFQPKQINHRDQKLNLPKGKTINEQDREFSKILYKQMRVEKCGGDFCDYVMMEKKTGPLALRKNIFQEYEKHFGPQKEDLGNIAINLPNEINNQLILKVRQRSDKVILLLTKNRIFMKNSKLMGYQNEENIKIDDQFIKEEYPFKFKSFKYDNYENLYKRIKICKACFIIYSLASKHFDEDLKKVMLQEDEKKKRPFSRQQSAPQFIHDQSQLNFGQKPQTSDQNYRNKRITSQRNNTMFSGGQTLPSINNKSQSQIDQDFNTQTQINEEGSQIQKKRPNSMRQGMPPKSASKKRLLPNTKKDIEINRLTLGFMNYDKLKNIYNEPQQSQIVSNNQGQTQYTSSTFHKDSGFQLMKNNEEIAQKKKLLNSDTNYMNQINEEKKSIKKKATSEQEYIKLIQNRYQQGIKNQQPQHLLSSSMFYNNSYFNHVRKIPEFQLSSTLKPITDDLHIQLMDTVVDIEYVCKKMNYTYPPVNTEGIDYLIIDEYTAIPYMLIESSPIPTTKEDDLQQNDEIKENNNNKEENLQKENSQIKQEDQNQENQRQQDIQNQENNDQNNKSLAKNSENDNENENDKSNLSARSKKLQNLSQQFSMHNSQKNKQSDEAQSEIVIFAQDFFDSFLEYQDIFIHLCKFFPKKKFLLFNLPGQSYTMFSKKQKYDSIKQIEVIDRLLYHIEFEKKLINVKNHKLNFIGYGYGGFILQSFLTLSYRHLPNFGSIQLINSFIEIDSILEDTLLKSLEVFETCPDNMQELPFNYQSVFTNSIPLDDNDLKIKMQINPISTEGRICIIKGLLSSQSMGDRFERLPIQAQIVHTLKNCFVSINQSDKLAKFIKEEDGELNIQNYKKTESKNIQRLTKYIDGGHSLIEENVNMLAQLIKEFLQIRF